jgi:hypothetical protein
MLPHEGAMGRHLRMLRLDQYSSLRHEVVRRSVSRYATVIASSEILPNLVG